MGKKNYIGLLFFIFIILFVPLIVRNEYYLGILVFAAFNCLTCIGLSLLMGYAGQISLGHAAFVGIGAYTTGYLTVNMGVTPWISLICGIFAVIVISLFIGIPSLRLKGHYLAMATLGFGAIVHIVLVAAVDITGGPSGISGIPVLSVFGFPVDNDFKYYFFSWGIVVIGLYFALNIVNSRVGRALRAIHGSEDASGSAGIDTSRYKIRIFVLSAIYSSISGSFYSHYVSYIDPGPFNVMHSVLLVTMVAVGGMHKLWGAVIGSVLLSVLPEILSSLSDLFEKIHIEYQTDYDTIVYGAILLIIMLFLPEGLFDGIVSFLTKIKNSFKKMSER